MSLVGEWSPRYHEDQPDRIPGPELGDYTGLPLTDGARLAADSWDASRLTLREHQCKVHNGPYILHGPIQFRIWEDKDPRTQQLVALQMYLNTYEQERTIWMDGRPHPPECAPHTWQGFSTGKWDGDILTVYTTHIKQEWIRRNGVPNSEKSTMIEHFIRHGNIMTHLVQWTDPVYLDRAADAQRRLRAQRAHRRQLAVAVRIRRRDRRSSAQRRAALPAGQESVRRRLRLSVRRAGRRRQGRRRDDVSGVHGEAEDAAEAVEAGGRGYQAPK